jgi:hypothetical protein
MKHWICQKCGHKTDSKSDMSTCPKGLFGHNFTDALKLPMAAVFVWPYPSVQAFEKGERDLNKMGFNVDSVTEITRPIGAGRFLALGPAAFLVRPKGVMVTYRRPAN